MSICDIMTLKMFISHWFEALTPGSCVKRNWKMFQLFRIASYFQRTLREAVAPTVNADCVMMVQKITSNKMHFIISVVVIVIITWTEN